MGRQPDSEIPPRELLYRRISADDVIGDEVQPCAVDLPASSFNRHSYSTRPEDVLDQAKYPADTGIASFVGADLPGPFPRSSNPTVYEYFVADDPVEGNQAHCEVRMRRRGERYSKNHEVKEIAALAQEALAKKMRVFKAPS